MTSLLENVKPWLEPGEAVAYAFTGHAAFAATLPPPPVTAG